MELKDDKSSNNQIISKSIVYGSIAFWLGKKADDTVSHKWVVYVRGSNNEDISYFIKEVVFTLHSSFENNVRVINKYPFEIYEAGWGEFDIKIQLNFIDDSIKPIEFVHSLKLYPQANISMSTKKPIVSENYEEIIFVNPKPQLKEFLTNPSAIKREHPLQVQMNQDDDGRSGAHSFLSQSEEKVSKSLSEKRAQSQVNIRKEHPYKISDIFDKMNLGAHAEFFGSHIPGTAVPFLNGSEGINFTSSIGNNNVTNYLQGDYEYMSHNHEMQVDYPIQNVNIPIDSESMVSYALVIKQINLHIILGC